MEHVHEEWNFHTSTYLTASKHRDSSDILYKAGVEDETDNDKLEDNYSCE